MGKIGITRRLAEFVVNTKYGELPAEAINAAKRLIMDTLGCGIAGSVFPEKELTPKPSDSVLIITDSDMNPNVWQSVAAAANGFGCERSHL